MSRLTILHIVHDFLPHHKHGTEQATYHLAKSQQTAGHRVAVFAGERGKFHKEVEIKLESYDGLDVYRTWFNPRSENGFLKHPGFASRFAEFLDDFKPDIVHIQHLSTLSLDLVHVVREKGLPIVGTLHDYFYVCPRVQLIKGDRSLCEESNRLSDCVACLADSDKDPLLERLGALPTMVRKNLFVPRSWRGVFSYIAGVATPTKPLVRMDSIERMRHRTTAVDQALAQFQRIIAPSADLARRFERYAEMKEGRVTALHHTVDTSALTFRKRVNLKAPVKIGYAGKILRVKGLEVLLNAVAKLPAGLVEVDVYGAPSWSSLEDVVYFRRMKKLAETLPVTIHSEGYKPEQVGQIFDSFDLFVIPSIWYENSPLVIQEAFAAGVPVVCTDQGGPGELVRDGVDGRHFKHRDAGSLASVLRELAEEPSKIEKLSANVVRPRTQGNYLEDVLKIYMDAIEEVQHG